MLSLLRWACVRAGACAWVIAGDGPKCADAPRSRPAPTQPRARSALRGQSMVELALVGMVIASMLLGIYELVTMYTTYGALEEAARSGARIVSLNYSDAETIDRVTQSLDSRGLNTVTGGQCDVSEIDIYEAMDRNNQAPSAPPPMQQYYLSPGADTYGGGCVAVLNDSYSPPFDQTTRNIVAVAAQGQEPATVGVRVTYRYHYRTPVVRVFGAVYTFSASAIFALGGDNADNFQAIVPQNPPAPPPVPAPPSGLALSAAPAPWGYSVISPTITISPTGSNPITTTGVMLLTNTTTLSKTGTLPTPLSVTVTGAITGTMVGSTYTLTKTANLWSSQPFTGTGVLTATALAGTSAISETYYDPYDPGATQATHGYTLTWTVPYSPALLTIPSAGFLVYLSHLGAAPSAVPGVYPGMTVPISSANVISSGTLLQFSYPYTGLPAVYTPYQPYLSPGDYFYVTSVLTGVESLPSTPLTVTTTIPEIPVRAPPTYTPPPGNFEVSLPPCDANGTYPAQLGITMSWDAVPGAGGYIVSYVHFWGAAHNPQYSTSNLAGTTSAPYAQVLYPPAGTTYSPSGGYSVGDYWTVAAVVNGVPSQSPAISAAATLTCGPSSQ